MMDSKDGRTPTGRTPRPPEFSSAEARVFAMTDRNVANLDQALVSKAGCDRCGARAGEAHTYACADIRIAEARDTAIREDRPVVVSSRPHKALDLLGLYGPKWGR